MSSQELLEAILHELKRMNDLAEGRMEAARKEVLYTPAEAAEYIGRTRQTVCSYEKRGWLHKVCRCGRKGYLKSELDRIIGI